jgi:V/A-type H+-transporting ATPase subunit I
MAIAKIKKIEIIGLKDNQDEILTLLQRLGIVDLINIRDRTVDKSPAIIPSDINLLEIEEAISFLASFSNKATFLESIANLKPIVYQEELKNVINNFGWQAFINELSVLRSRLKDLIHHKDNLIQRKQLLLPWRNLGLSLDQMHQTQYCDIFLGILLSRDYQDLLQKALKENINFYSEVISQDKTNTYLSVLYIREDFERLETILKNYHFNFVTLGHYKGKVKDNLFEISNDTLILNDQIQEIKNKIIQLTKEQFKLKVIYDHLNVINKRKQADKNLSGQEYTFALSGWIKYKEIKFLEKELSHSFKEIAIFISEPKEGESVPVVLENRRLIQPFEFVTQIYGMPKYNELDPTPFLAPFFFLYFGFCVSDAGYGFILVLISWFILKKFKMGSQGNKFWRLFLFCGISTIIIGALTGSWFGNALDLLSQTNKIFLPLKRSKDSLTLFDPLKEPTKLLGIALFLGIIQVWFGNIVAGIGNIKNKRYLDIVLDQIPMLTLLFGLTGLGLIFLKLLDNTHIGLFKYATIFASVALIFTQGRSEKGLGSKFFYGIYNLYNALSGYLSDILSYSRLWALGLVTGVMAMTINLIAMQFSQILVSMIPSIDKIIFIKILISASVIIIIFILGHAISFLINLIGAFVHPVRLQFVEFFSKFFKSGGNSFKPFKIETKYINIS